MNYQWGKYSKQLDTSVNVFHPHKIYRYFIILTVLLSLSVNGFAEDSDGDGLSDQIEIKIGAEAYLSDTDGDGVNDGDEVGSKVDSPRDSDSDSIFDVLDYDDDNDGLPTFLELKIDSDNDGLVDYLDKDSDNDGILDGEEAGFLNQDKNYDGVDDAFDVNRVGAIDNNGDGIDDNVSFPDHNSDGKPDYLDVNYQYRQQKENTPILVKKTSGLSKIAASTLNKSKLEETKKAIVNTSLKDKSSLSTTKEKTIRSATKSELVINRNTDTDNDGLSNLLEKRLGTNPLKRDSDSDNVSDAIEIGIDINTPQDSDHDGIIDALDNDDDNDGVLTKHEDINKDSTAINDDTDADGVPNYLDANDDGDDKLTRDESHILDSDKDGIPDYLDKNDGFKDPMIASLKPRETDADKNKEPEVVILFDGNAAELAEEYDHEDEVFSNDLTAKDQMNIGLGDTTALALVNATVESNGKESQKVVKDVVKTKEETRLKSKVSTAKRTKSHWDLF